MKEGTVHLAKEVGAPIGACRLNTDEYLLQLWASCGDHDQTSHKRPQVWCCYRHLFTTLAIEPYRIRRPELANKLLQKSFYPLLPSHIGPVYCCPEPPLVQRSIIPSALRCLYTFQFPLTFNPGNGSSLTAWSWAFESEGRCVHHDSQRKDVQPPGTANAKYRSE